LYTKKYLFHEIVNHLGGVLSIADVPEMIAGYLPIAAALRHRSCTEASQLH
jgi:hypothetical protein